MSAIVAAGPTGLGSLFANMKIRMRVILGFLCVLAILAVISLISDAPLPPSHYKRRLSGLHGLSHVTTAHADVRSVDVAA